VTSSWFLFFS